MIRRGPFVVAWVFAIGGCSSESGEDRPYAVRDSAGIEVVESSAPLWTSKSRWRVDSVPTFQISGEGDSDLYRLSSPILLDDQVVVFNGGTCEVRFYDMTGGHLRSAGRCGEGPGEFGTFVQLWTWPEDSLVVVEQVNRATILSDQGEIGRMVKLPTSDQVPLPFVRGILDDRTLLIWSDRNPPGRSSPGTERAAISLGLLKGLSDTPQLLETLPGPTWVYTEFSGSLGRTQLAFSGSTKLAVGGKRFFVGFPERYQIEVRRADGSLERIIRRAFEPTMVERSDIDWLMERRLSQVEGEDNRRLVRQAYRDLEHAERMPAFGRPSGWPGGAKDGPDMLADDEGNLWIFRHYRPGEYRNDWDVFSTEGVWLGVVELPEDLVPSQIGEDFVVGTWTNEMGFEHAGVFRLAKP